MLKIFISYSPSDIKIKDEIDVHLSVLKRDGLIDTWHDRKIEPGEDRDKVIHSEISTADIIIVLVSPYFLSSSYLYEKELYIALKRHSKNETILIPIILDPCDWQHTQLRNFSSLPSDGKPISSFSNYHVPLAEIALKLRQLAETHTKKTNICLDSKSIFVIKRIRKQEKIDAAQIACLAFDPIGKYVAFSQDHAVFLMPLNDFPVKVGNHENLQSKFYCDNNNDSHEYKITEITFSPNGKYLASSDGGGKINIWDIQNNKLLFHLDNHTDSITSISFSKDGKLFASAGYDEKINIYKVADSNLLEFSLHKTFYKKSNIKGIAKYKHDIEQIQSMTFSNEGNHIVTGDQQGIITVREVDTSKEVFRKKIHNDRITGIAFSPIENGLLVTCSDDTRIRLVDCFNNGKGITLGEGESKHKDSMNSVSFSFDGKVIISSACDRFIKIWDVESRSLIETHEDKEAEFPVDRVSFYPQKYDFGTNTFSSDISLWTININGEILETTFEHKDSK